MSGRRHRPPRWWVTWVEWAEARKHPLHPPGVAAYQRRVVRITPPIKTRPEADATADGLRAAGKREVSIIGPPAKGQH